MTFSVGKNEDKIKLMTKLESRYEHQKTEEKIYKLWEKSGYFDPDNLPAPKSSKLKAKSFTIIMPPPNANGSLHLGHAVFVTLQDILIRFWRMRGRKTLWLPGADHAGFETQVVFDKKLEKEGRNRFAIDRETFFQEIWDFTQKNKKIMEDQLRKLGASCDWSREKFTLDPDIVKIVYKTFEKLYEDGLVYRGLRVINWCPKHKTALSDLEVKYVERKDPLYFIKYGPLTLATVRPETKFGDTALAVNPKDKRYQEYIGREIEAQGLLGPLKFKVISDEAVDPKFGTGVVKVTPAHDPADFEIWQRHRGEIPGPKIVIDEDGRLTGEAGVFKGLKISEARRQIVEEMERLGILEKTENDYIHQVAICYKCGTVLEPLPKSQWFIRMTAAPHAQNQKSKIKNQNVGKSLRDAAVGAVKSGQVKIIPQRFEKVFFHWLKNLRDWNVSRQIVWGIRIPAFYCLNCSNNNSQQLPRMGFDEDVVQQVLKGKIKTYRLRDHGFKIGDKVIFENSQTKMPFGYGIITEVEETIVEKINYRDPRHYKTYKNLRELMAAFKLRNPDKPVTPKTKAYLYGYEFHRFSKKEAAKLAQQSILINPAIKSRWFIVRHGETDWNKEGKTRGITIPLNEEGRRQARQAAAALKNKDIDLIISSDLSRCRETAEIIKQVTDAELVLDKNLRERDFGITEGMLREERDKMYYDELYSYEGKPPGGESFKELEQRVLRAFKEHKKNHQHKNIVIVTHGGPIRMLFKNIKNWSFEETLQNKVVANAEITELILSQPCPVCGNDLYEQDPDVFDTWFSSGQWPFATLMTSGHQSGSNSKIKNQKSKIPRITNDFREFYPTDMMETGYDILFFWVARMLMLGLYATGEVPFRHVYLHGMVRDKDRQKMSKSKGNVIDPLGVAEIYGADALRFALVAGNSAGNDIVISEEKIRGYRNFATKIWNIGRFILMNKPSRILQSKIQAGRPERNDVKSEREITRSLTAADRKNIEQARRIKAEVAKHLEKFEFHLAAEKIYHYVWHAFADKIIENAKPLLKSGTEKERAAAHQTIETIFLECLKMLHPFIPFVTEEIYQKFLPAEAQAKAGRPGELLMVERW